MSTPTLDVLSVGDIVLTPHAAGSAAGEGVWGLCPHTGGALFIERETESFLAAMGLPADRPWTVTWWPRWEDGARAPHVNDHGRPRWESLTEALADAEAIVTGLWS